MHRARGETAPSIRFSSQDIGDLLPENRKDLLLIFRKEKKWEEHKKCFKGQVQK